VAKRRLTSDVREKIFLPRQSLFPAGREIEAGGGQALFVATDFSRAADAERVVQAAVQCWGAVHILHNNAYASETNRTVLTLEEAVDHPHLRGRKTVRKVSDPRLGDFDLPATGRPLHLRAFPIGDDTGGVALVPANPAQLRID